MIRFPQNASQFRSGRCRFGAPHVSQSGSAETCGRAEGVVSNTSAWAVSDAKLAQVMFDLVGRAGGHADFEPFEREALDVGFLFESLGGFGGQ